MCVYVCLSVPGFLKQECTVVNCHVVPGNWIPVWRSSQCSYHWAISLAPVISYQIVLSFPFSWTSLWFAFVSPLSFCEFLSMTTRVTLLSQILSPACSELSHGFLSLDPALHTLTPCTWVTHLHHSIPFFLVWTLSVFICVASLVLSYSSQWSLYQVVSLCHRTNSLSKPSPQFIFLLSLNYYSHSNFVL